MNKQVHSSQCVLKFILIGAALFGALVILSTPINAEGSNPAETVINEKAENVDVNGRVTAFDAYSLFYYRSPENAQCYRCSAPCSAYACCPGSHPQCCYVSGLGCGCCSH